MKPVSDKRAARRPERAEVVAAARARDRRFGCRARHAGAPGACSTELMHELDPHELLPRSAWADGIYELSNVVMVCRAHHRWIDAEPAEAAVLGLHRFSWQLPPDEPELLPAIDWWA